MWIGNVLKEAREAQGCSIEEVSERTKIKCRYIQALEEESFDVLPGRVYAKGFLRSYARFLGLSSEELIDRFEKQYKDLHSHGGTPDRMVQLEKQFIVKDMASIPKTGDKRKKLFWQSRRRFVEYALFVVIVGLLVILGIQLSGKEADFQQDVSFRQEQGGNSVAPKDFPGGNGQEKPVAPEANPEFSQSKGVGFERRGVDLVLTVTRESCWMRVVADGEVKYEGELTARQSRSFQADERIEVKLGNAGAVQAQLNGRDLGYMGKRGDVMEKEFLAPANG